MREQAKGDLRSKGGTRDGGEGEGKSRYSGERKERARAGENEEQELELWCKRKAGGEERGRAMGLKQSVER